MFGRVTKRMLGLVTQRNLGLVNQRTFGLVNKAALWTSQKGVAAAPAIAGLGAAPARCSRDD